MVYKNFLSILENIPTNKTEEFTTVKKKNSRSNNSADSKLIWTLPSKK